jgi:hypothetical protein
MDCEQVRDRFSSLWEKELSSDEERSFKEHLSSCPKCQREFEQFGKTMQWLHAVGEVEVPEGFLSELYKKIGEKKKAIPGEKSRERGFHFPHSFKLPAQALAMVAVVFVVLYLTKMMPIDGYRLKEPKQVPSPLSVEKKSEKVLGQRAVERDRRALETPTETPRPRGIEQAEGPVPKEGKLEDATVPQVKAEAKKREATARSTGAIGSQTVASKEAARAKTPLPEPGKSEEGWVAKDKSMVTLKPPREMILRVSDRERVISRLYEMVKQFGGEVVATEGDMFLASLPTGSFTEFEKELAGLSSSGKTDLSTGKKPVTGSLRFEEGMKPEEVDQKSKEPARLAVDTERRTIVRILVVQE